MADRVGIVIELIGKDAAISSLQQIQSIVNQLNNKRTNINVGITGHRNVLTTLGSISKGIGGMLTTTSQVMNRTGGMLTQIGNMFGGSILNKAGWYAVGAGMRMFSEGISNSAQRFDTFRTFPKIMNAIGYSTADSERAINKLNEAVLGLPTSLNDIVDSSKSFIQLYNDLDKGTDLAIAANNAFLANASDEQQVYYGMKQIRDILSKGKLQDREWESLFAALGVSTQYIGEQMGYGADKVGEFRTALKKGEIDAREFLDAMIQAGTGTGKLVEMANVQKDTISGTVANIKNAFANLGASTLQAFDDLFVRKTGEGIPANIKKISDSIKTNLIPAVEGWVDSHGDKIFNFFDKLASFNWGKLGSAISGNAEKLFDFYGKILGKIGEDNIIKFVAFATTWASPLGKALQLMSRPIGLMGMLFTKFGRLLGKAGRFGGALGKGGTAAAGTGGIAQAFAFLGEIAVVGGLIAEFAKVGEVVAGVNLDGFEDNIWKVAGLLGAGGGVSALLTAAGSLLDKAGLSGHVLAGEGLTLGLEGLTAGVGGLLTQFTKIAEDISTADLNNFDKNVEKIGKFLGIVAGITGGTTAGFGMLSGFTGGIGGVFAAIGEALTGATLENIRQAGNRISQFVGVAQEISDAEFPSATKIERMGNVVQAISDAFTSNINIDENTVESINNALESIKAISRDLYAFENIADAEIDLTGASEKISEIVTTLGEISSSMYQAFPETSWESGEQANIMKNMLSVLDNLKQTIPLFNEIQNTIDSIGAEGVTQETGTFTAAGVTTVNREYIRDKFQGTIDQINEIIAGMRDISNQITPSATIIGALHERIKSSIQDNIIKNYSATMAQINGLMAAIGATDTAQAGVGTAPQGARDLFDRKREQIAKVLDGIQGLMEDIGGKITVLGTATEWFDSAANKHILENLKTSMDSIRDIMVKTNLSMATMNRIDIEQLPDFEEKVTTFMSSIKDITNAFTMEGFSQNAADTGIDYGVMATNLESLALAMGSVKEMVAEISAMESDLEGIMGRGRDGSTMSQLSEAIQGLQNALANIPDDAEDVQAKAEQLKTAMDSVNQIVTTLAGMQENLATVQENDSGQAVGGVISSIVDAITGGGDVEAATAQIQAISDLIANLDTNLQTLGTVDLSALTDSVGQLSSAMDTLKGSLDNVYSALQNVARGAIEANTAINNLANTAQSRASSFNVLVGQLASLAGALAGATSNALNLASAINSIPTSRTVTVTYNQVGSPGGAAVGGTYVAATGGLVPQYRALGGTIFAMRPKGSDTVPAMLTPGEFVLRKKAVDHLGIPFLRALNGLNIPGAIDRLMMGIRTPSGYGVVSNDNRKIYNNNQKVNQNIYTNNPSYANRRANRWAKSL